MLQIAYSGGRLGSGRGKQRFRRLPLRPVCLDRQSGPQKATHQQWNRDHSQQISTEPVFVPRPVASEEDDGVLSFSTPSRKMTFRSPSLSDPDFERWRQAVCARAQRPGHAGTGALHRQASATSRILCSVLLILLIDIVLVLPTVDFNKITLKPAFSMIQQSEFTARTD